jgi:hypothetical protein
MTRLQDDNAFSEKAGTSGAAGRSGITSITVDDGSERLNRITQIRSYPDAAVQSG